MLPIGPYFGIIARMRIKPVLSLVLCVLLLGGAAFGQQPSRDVVTMDAIIASLYDVISGPAGQKRDWDRFRALFVPGARLIPTVKQPTGGSATRVLDPDGYVTASGPTLETNGFYEKEVSRQVEMFGNIAHVFSTYESRRKADDAKPFARGINSIQLMNDGKRWWVVTVYWQAESPDNPLPSKYLPKP